MIVPTPDVRAVAPTSGSPVQTVGVIDCSTKFVDEQIAKPAAFVSRQSAPQIGRDLLQFCFAGANPGANDRMRRRKLSVCITYV